MSKIKVASMNVGSLFDGNDKCKNASNKRMSFLTGIIKETNTELLCLQEMPDDEHVGYEIRTAMGADYAYFFETSESHVFNGKMGISVFSKIPMEQIAFFPLPAPQREFFYNGRKEVLHDKYFVFINLLLKNKNVLLVNGHFFPIHRYLLDDNMAIFEGAFYKINKNISYYMESGQYNGMIFCADMNCPEPLKMLPALKNCRNIFENEPTRPSGRRTDIISVSNNYLIDEKRNINGIGVDKGYFDHNFLFASISVDD